MKDKFRHEAGCLLYALAKQGYGQGRQVYHFLTRAVRRSKRKLINAYFPLLEWRLENRLHSMGDSVGLVNSLLEGKDSCPLYAYKVFDRSIDSGHMVGQALLKERESIECEDLRAYLRVRYFFAQNFDHLAPMNISGLIADICAYGGPERQLSRLKGLLAKFVVGRYGADDALCILEAASVENGDVSEHIKLKILSRIAQGSRGELLPRWRDRFSKELSPAALVKVYMYESELEGRGEISSFELPFCSLPFFISRYYLDFVKPIFDGIPAAQNFIDARYSSGKRDVLKSYILEKIRARQGCAYIRLGDGECYGFGCDEEFITEEGLRRQELHWWGCELDEALRAELQLRFQNSVSAASILGVPTISRLVRDFHLKKAEAYPVNSLMCRILAVIKGSAPLLASRLVVEDQSNLFIFNRALLDKIFDLADKVVFVSGLASDSLSDRFSHAKIKFIEIPTHQLLRGQGFASAKKEALPFVYLQYEKEIVELAGPGVVFLVSAGFIGKLFIAEAARKGAVALDVGQYLASYVSSSEVAS